MTSSPPGSESERCGMREEPAGRAGPAEEGGRERPVARGNFPGPRWRGEEREGCVAGGERGGGGWGT